MRRIYLNIDWPAFWLRFAGGAAAGLLLGVCLRLGADATWPWVAGCPAAVGLLVGVFGAEFWQDFYRWW